MELLHAGLNWLFLLMQGLTGAIGLYQIVLSFFGLWRREEKIIHAPSKKFAVLVAAHNEEDVIAPLVDNLLRLDYPKELFDLYVICDNCNDQTADIVRANGARAMERFDMENRGKGFAIEWMLDQLWAGDKRYDAVVMFDADNLASPNFLRVMNEKLCQGKKVIQGYLDIKNPMDSWVSVSLAIAYWFTNRMWQLARYNLGLSCALGGTGLCVDMALLQEIGWGATGLTEDLEFGVRCVERGIFPTWAHDAKVFDEKPIHLLPSMRQRLRWMQGHFNCASAHMMPLLVKSFRMRSLAMFDAALYLFQPMRFLMLFGTSFVLFVHIAWPSLWNVSRFTDLLPMNFWIIVNVLLFLQMPLAMYLEKANWRAYFGLLLFPIFSVTWFPVTFKAFFTRKNSVWAHTVHTRAIRLEELEIR